VTPSFYNHLDVGFTNSTGAESGVLVDWTQVWRYANQILAGATFSSLKKQGLIRTKSDEAAFKEAMKDPEFNSTQTPATEGGVCSISDELLLYLTEGIEPSWFHDMDEYETEEPTEPQSLP